MKDNSISILKSRRDDIIKAYNAECRALADKLNEKYKDFIGKKVKLVVGEYYEDSEVGFLKGFFSDGIMGNSVIIVLTKIKSDGTMSKASIGCNQPSRLDSKRPFFELTLMED